MRLLRVDFLYTRPRKKSKSRDHLSWNNTVLLEAINLIVNYVVLKSSRSVIENKEVS